jgi:hypothetical protein
MKLFRERLLARLAERHAISENLGRKLVAWKHPGFASHVVEAIPFENKKAIEDLALARLADHIPDPGRHRTHFYANRVRGERPDEEAGRHGDDPEPTTGRRSSPSWARLLAKVFQVDPLACRRCSGPLKVVAYITDSPAIRQILEHLGLSPPEKPPPDIREVLRVAVDEQGREIEAQPA